MQDGFANYCSIYLKGKCTNKTQQNNLKTEKSTVVTRREDERSWKKWVEMVSQYENGE